MKHLNSIAAYHDEIETKEIVSSGHHLYISNQFKMNKDVVLNSFNYMLKSGKKINCFDDIRPQCLYESNFSKQKPKVQDYNDFIDREHLSLIPMSESTR